MTSWLQTARRNWDAFLAFGLVYFAIALVLGPGWYFLTLYLNGCVYIIHRALWR